ncbi:helix-turn-helix domain-containing protein [Rhodoblastus acidophilus]|uniref:helix-turn-helix domain-containing protein n=1 Tax=Rhodoblastus acidophilus TaxID=1074 RepID=UPI003CD00DD5
MSTMSDANPVDTFVGARLRERRMQRGLPLNALAARTDVTAMRLLCFEEGRERIPAKVMLAFCRVLDIQPAYFFEWAAMDETSPRGGCEPLRLHSSGSRRRF